jgi:sulfite exporter TauE/SafE
VNLELLLPVAFLAGLFGGGHCLGMCGPIVVMFESPAAANTNGSGLGRRLAYNTGRLLFYCLLGVVAGALGTVLTKLAGVDAGLRVLRVVAAGLVVALGLNLLLNIRLLRSLESGGSAIWRRLSPLAKHVVPMSNPMRALAAGFLWGALPCGLVYSAIAMAATTGSGIGGGMVMSAFWLGTLPSLLLAGASAQKLGQWSKRPALRRLTGATLVLVGLFALLMPFLHMGGGSAGHGNQHAEYAEHSQSTRE